MHIGGGVRPASGEGAQVTAHAEVPARRPQQDRAARIRGDVGGRVAQGLGGREIQGVSASGVVQQQLDDSVGVADDPDRLGAHQRSSPVEGLLENGAHILGPLYSFGNGLLPVPAE